MSELQQRLLEEQLRQLPPDVMFQLREIIEGKILQPDRGESGHEDPSSSQKKEAPEPQGKIQPERPPVSRDEDPTIQARTDIGDVDERQEPQEEAEVDTSGKPESQDAGDLEEQRLGAQEVSTEAEAGSGLTSQPGETVENLGDEDKGSPAEEVVQQIQHNPDEAGQDHGDEEDLPAKEVPQQDQHNPDEFSRDQKDDFPGDTDRNQPAKEVPEQSVSHDDADKDPVNTDRDLSEVQPDEATADGDQNDSRGHTELSADHKGAADNTGDEEVEIVGEVIVDEKDPGATDKEKKEDDDDQEVVDILPGILDSEGLDMLNEMQEEVESLDLMETKMLFTRQNETDWQASVVEKSISGGTVPGVKENPPPHSPHEEQKEAPRDDDKKERDQKKERGKNQKRERSDQKRSRSPSKERKTRGPYVRSSTLRTRSSSSGRKSRRTRASSGSSSAERRSRRKRGSSRSSSRERGSRRQRKRSRSQRRGSSKRSSDSDKTEEDLRLRLDEKKNEKEAAETRTVYFKNQEQPVQPVQPVQRQERIPKKQKLENVNLFPNFELNVLEAQKRNLQKENERISGILLSTRQNLKSADDTIALKNKQIQAKEGHLKDLQKNIREKDQQIDNHDNNYKEILKILEASSDLAEKDQRRLKELGARNSQLEQEVETWMRKYKELQISASAWYDVARGTQAEFNKNQVKNQNQALNQPRPGAKAGEVPVEGMGGLNMWTFPPPPHPAAGQAGGELMAKVWPPPPAVSSQAVSRPSNDMIQQQKILTPTSAPPPRVGEGLRTVDLNPRMALHLTREMDRIKKIIRSRQTN